MLGSSTTSLTHTRYPSLINYCLDYDFNVFWLWLLKIFGRYQYVLFLNKCQSHTPAHIHTYGSRVHLSFLFYLMAIWKSFLFICLFVLGWFFGWTSDARNFYLTNRKQAPKKFANLSGFGFNKKGYAWDIISINLLHVNMLTKRARKR